MLGIWKKRGLRKAGAVKSGKALVKKDEAVLEATLEGGEVVADVLMRGDLIADIPLIGTAVKACRAMDSIRNQMFASKIARFLVPLEKLATGEKDAFKEKIRSSGDGGQKVGETLLLVLERVTDLDKPKLLAQLFVAYLDEVITADDLRRMAQAVDMAFGDDLRELLALQGKNEFEGEWLQNLVASGLGREGKVKQSWAGAEKNFIVSPLGHKLRNAYFHGRARLE